MKKIPYRMCIVTHERLPKYEMIRVVKDKLGDVKVDLHGKANGRGIYLKKDIETIKKARDKKIIDTSLDVNVPESIYEELLNIVGAL